jgi:acyl dehydratase
MATRMSERLGEWTPDQAQIDAWAILANDHNPLHVDPAAAARSPYGGTIVHGHLTLAILAEHLRTAVGPDWLAAGDLEQIRFRAPVRPGMRVFIEVDPSVDSLRAGGDCKLTVVNEQGEILVSGNASMEVDQSK